MNSMFKVGDRILVKNSPYYERTGHYGTITEFLNGGRLIRAKMDNPAAFVNCLLPGYYTIAVESAKNQWVIAGPRKSNRGFAKFVRKIEEVA